MVEAKITTVILIIVALIVIFQIVGQTSTNMADASNSITDANNCSDDPRTDSTGAKFTYDQTTKQCENSSGDDQYLAQQYDLPLNNLFASNGVIWLIFMAGLLIMIVVMGLKGFRKK